MNDDFIKYKSNLSEIFQAVTDSIVVIDDNHKIVMFNHAAEKLFQYKSKNLVGKSIEILIPENFRSGHADNVNDFGKSGKISRRMAQSRDIYGLRSDGKEIPIEVTISKIMEHGKTLYTAILRDITERIRMENINKTLYTISREVNTTSTFKDFCCSVQETLYSIIKFDEFFIALNNENQKKFTAAFNRTCSGEMISKENHKGYDSKIKKVLKNNKSVLVSINKNRKNSNRQNQDSQKSTNWLGIPLKNEDKTIGVLILENYSKSNLFSTEDVKLLEFVSEQIAVAINSKLRDDKLKKLSSAVEQTADLVMITDYNGIIEYVNPSFEKHTGFKKEDIIGSSSNISKSGMHYEDYYRNLWDIILSGKVFRDVIINKKKSGEIYYEEKTISPLRDLSGKITHFVSTGKDITEKKLIENELKVSEERFDLAMEGSNDGYWDWDIKNGRKLWWSHKMYEILGFYDQEYDPNYSNFKKLIHPDDRAKVLDALRDHFKRRFPYHIEYRMITASNECIWVLARGQALRDKNGKPVRMAGSIQDITKRKRMENQLNEAQKIAHIGSWERDLHSNHVYWSDELYRIHGYEPGEIKPSFEKLLDDLIYPGDRNRFLKEIKTAKVKKSDFNLNLRFFRKDGGVFDGQTKGKFSYDSSGNPSKVSGTFQDITERLKVERELRKTEKLESLGILAGGIAHDFNNILNAISLNLSYIQLMYDSKDKTLEVLKQTEKATIRAKELSNQLLTFAKGGLPAIKATSIQRLLEDTASFTLSGSNVRYELNISENLWNVEIDEGQISQVFGNLLINANQALPNGGLIRISAQNYVKNTNIGSDKRGENYVEIKVNDNGIGIDVENIHKIFDPFFSTKKEGSGLGLATAFSIIKNHSGTIEVTSEPNAGTTFTVYLPALNKNQDEKKFDETIKPKKTGKILILEDDEMVCEALHQMLIAIGYEVCAANEGETALKLFKKAIDMNEPFDISILDLTIPGGLGGKDTLEEMRKIDPNTKAIISSGYSKEEIIGNYEKFGFSGVVTKPYSVQDLIQVLNDVATQ